MSRVGHLVDDNLTESILAALFSAFGHHLSDLRCKTTERGGTRGFDGYKRVKGRKHHILVDTLGLMIANRVEPANVLDLMRGGSSAGWPEPSVPTDSNGDRRCRARKPKSSPAN